MQSLVGCPFKFLWAVLAKLQGKKKAEINFRPTLTLASLALHYHVYSLVIQSEVYIRAIQHFQISITAASTISTLVSLRITCPVKSHHHFHLERNRRWGHHKMIMKYRIHPPTTEPHFTKLSLWQGCPRVTTEYAFYPQCLKGHQSVEIGPSAEDRICLKVSPCSTMSGTPVLWARWHAIHPHPPSKPMSRICQVQRIP